MKLKNLREHYQSSDNGKSWTPKKPFDSEEQVRNEGFLEEKWHTYVCSHCAKIHIAGIKKEFPNDG